MLFVSSGFAQTSLPVPALSARVMDLTSTLDADQAQSLERKLAALEAGTGAQVVVLIVASTAPEDIAVYAQRVGDTWKLGRKDVGDGVILVIAKNDRKLRIEVAKTLEGAIPDLMASRVINQAIAPRFKQGDFAGGIDVGVEQLSTLIRGEHLPSPESGKGSTAGFQWMDLAVFLFFASAIGGSIARQALGTRIGSLLIGLVCGGIVFYVTRTWWLAGAAALAGLLMTLISSMSRVGSHSGISAGAMGGHRADGWGGGTSSGSGGFRSGGGGNFGGGGASGGW